MKQRNLVLLVVVLLLLIILLPTWPYSTGWGLGYWPSGGLGLVLLILLLLIVLEKI